MIIDYSKITQTNTDFFRKYYTFDDTHHFAQQTGQHYKLLTYVSSLFDGITILDVGTYDGASCLALAQNPNNNVITYDIENIHYPKLTPLPFLNDYPNVRQKVLDINLEVADVIKSAKIIFLDIVHDGIAEKKISDMLEKINYQGYVFCDDVFSTYHPACTQWFANLTIEKYNLTEIGGHNGTGLLNYYDDKSVIIKKD